MTELVHKRSILNGLLSGLNFAIQTAKIDHLRIDYNKLCFQKKKKLKKKKIVLYKVLHVGTISWMSIIQFEKTFAKKKMMLVLNFHL